tara:strand:+ start:2342 stop:3469 length:1128 start_codon:yes stop_codon:yes gene_type:complete
MSTLLVNNIKSYTGDTVTISGSQISVQGRTTLGDGTGTDTLVVRADSSFSGSLEVSGSVTPGGFTGIDSGVHDLGALTSKWKDLYLSGTVSSSIVSASYFVGDGSQITGVTGEWDGTHNGDAEITGSLILSGSGPTSLTIESSTHSGNIKDARLNIIGDISASNITASGTIFGESLQVGKDHPSFGVLHITNAGNVSSSGYVSASAFVGGGSQITDITFANVGNTSVTAQSGTGAEDLTGTSSDLIWYASTTQAGDITLPQATVNNVGMKIKIIAAASWATSPFKLGFTSGGSTVMTGRITVSALDAVLTTTFPVTSNAKNLVIDADAVATAGGAIGSVYEFTYLTSNLVLCEANAFITTGTVATTAAASVTGGI